MKEYIISLDSFCDFFFKIISSHNKKIKSKNNGVKKFFEEFKIAFSCYAIFKNNEIKITTKRYKENCIPLIININISYENTKIIFCLDKTETEILLTLNKKQLLYLYDVLGK